MIRSIARSGRDVLRHIAEKEAIIELWAPHAKTLSPEERQWIAAGYYGVIERPIEPEWQAGDWLEVASNLRIKVTGKTWHRNTYRTTFDVQDFRPRLPRRTPPVFELGEKDEHGIPKAPTRAAIAEATLSGNYTASHALAVPDIGEEPTPREMQADRLKREVSIKDAYGQGLNRRRQDLVRYERRLIDARAKGRQSTVRILEVKIERVRSTLAKAA